MVGFSLEDCSTPRKEENRFPLSGPLRVLQEKATCRSLLDEPTHFTVSFSFLVILPSVSLAFLLALLLLRRLMCITKVFRSIIIKKTETL